MRNVKEVLAELDKAYDELEIASYHGDDERVEELSDLICALETEYEWIMI